MKTTGLFFALLAVLVPSALGGIDYNPDHTLLWNRFHGVRAVDSFAIVISAEGVGVSRYDCDQSEFLHTNQLFLDDEPTGMKIYGDILALRTLHETLVFVDIGNLPELTLLGGFDPGVAFSDFVWNGQEVYLSTWFDGVWRFLLSDFSTAQFADSSMKVILATQLHICDDTLFVLDEYNGISRYDISGDGFGDFIDYLYIPVRASRFFKCDSVFVISAKQGGVLVGEFGHAGSGITGSISDLASPEKTLLTDSMFVLVGDRFVNLVNRNNYDQLMIIPIGDDRVDGDIFVIDDAYYLLLPGADGGLALYNLHSPAERLAAFYRPGPIEGLLMYDGKLFTGGKANPVDVYSIAPPEEPLLDYTVYGDLARVEAMDHNGDTLIVLYGGVNKMAFITKSTNPDEYYAESSILVEIYDPFEIQFVDRWADTLAGVLVFGRNSISAYTIKTVRDTLDSLDTPFTYVEYTNTWDFLFGLEAAAVEDSLLFVSSNKRQIFVYRITADFDLEFVTYLNLSAEVREFMILNDRLVYFSLNTMNYIDCSGSGFPSVDTTITLAVPVTKAVTQGNRLYTVGPDGIGVYDVSTPYPTIIDYGGRPGRFLAADSGIIATSDGQSIHVYFLGDDLFTGVHGVDDQTARGFALCQSYPNPFNASTAIDYRLSAGADVRIAVYNVLGQTVRTLIDGPQSAGLHTVFWDATDDGGAPVASGVYFYQLSAGTYHEARKMLLLK